jgi:hypothetical protein
LERAVRIIAKSWGEAEQIIATIWITLERERIPSPKVQVQSLSPRLAIELTFEERNHEVIVSREALADDFRTDAAQ